MKELPKSFACKNTNQELWDKYISWLNTTYSEKFDGDSDIYPYYGITTNGFYDYHSSIIFFDTSISLEEWDEIVNGTQIKTEEVMKKYEIRRQELKKIHDVACNDWKEKITEYALRNPFGNTIEFTQIEVDEMFKASEKTQTKVLESIFGIQTDEIDLSTGIVYGIKVFEECGSTNSSLIAVRTHGKYKNKGFFLNSDYNWELAKDDNNNLCLLPTRR
jgi:hypothetical protein